ncbi:uncharacterized protein LOC119720096 [Patiria miniata]|uniref:Death domain-containing protein n=1 Tax=Patiria miniata TaxID=46514 RepID=A0A913Z1K6_PATMI|nr:uncharacterized protein LOC119720096 [Patiria miniata]
MLVTWRRAQSTSNEQQRTTLCTALKNIERADIAGFLNAATGKGDVTTSSPNANPSSPSPSPIPSTQASGVPAPRPQHSQRPDQEPRLRAPSYQDVGNKTRNILKEFYKTTGSYIQLLHEVDNDQKHIADIYTKVQLETREGVAVVTTGETVRKKGSERRNCKLHRV